MRGPNLAVGLVLLVGCREAGREAADPTGFSALTILTGDSVARVTSYLAIDPAGRPAFVWVEGRARAPGGTVYVRTAATERRAVTDSTEVASLDPETPPKITFGPDSAVYLLYNVEKRLDPKKESSTSIRVRRSADGGLTWSTPTVPADDGEYGVYRNDHAIHVAGDGSIYVTWLDWRTKGQMTLQVSHSVDRGATWSRNVAIDAVGPCECCRMAMASSADGRLYVAWRKVLPGDRRDIVVASSADRGQTWSDPVRVHEDDWEIKACPDAGPSMLADANGTLHVAWWTGKRGAAGVRYVRSIDGGKTWGQAIPLKVAERAAPSHVQLAADGKGGLVAIFSDGTREGKPIVVARSTDGGASFGGSRPVSEEGVSADYPVIGAGRDGLVIAWQENVPGIKGFRRTVVRQETP